MIQTKCHEVSCLDITILSLNKCNYKLIQLIYKEKCFTTYNRNVYEEHRR